MPGRIATLAERYPLFLYSPQPRKRSAPLTFVWDVMCERCWGRGWYTEESYSERYCEDNCEASKWRRVYDGDRGD